MRIERCPTKCAAKLGRGECKRVPRGALYLIGYYLGCPACGFAQAIRTEDASIVETGMDVGETPELSISLVTCSRCGKAFRVDRDEVLLG